VASTFGVGSLFHVSNQYSYATVPANRDFTLKADAVPSRPVFPG
jgi:hypothetical protein